MMTVRVGRVCCSQDLGVALSLVLARGHPRSRRGAGNRTRRVKAFLNR